MKEHILPKIGRVAAPFMVICVRFVLVIVSRHHCVTECCFTSRETGCYSGEDSESRMGFFSLDLLALRMFGLTSSMHHAIGANKNKTCMYAIP